MNYKKLSIFLATFIGIFLCFTFVAARISNPSSGGSQTPWTSDIDGGGFSLTNLLGATSTKFEIESVGDSNLIFDAYTGTGAYIYQLYSNGNTFYFDSMTDGGEGASPNFQFQNYANGGLFYIYGDGSFANNSSNASTNYIYGDLELTNGLYFVGDGANTGGLLLGSGSSDWQYIYNDGNDMILSTTWGDGDNGFQFFTAEGEAEETLMADLYASTGLTVYGSTTATALELTGANTGILFQSGKYQRNAPRWKDGASVVEATTTDEVYKIGNCLEPGAPAVTIDKVTAIIASTTFMGAENTEGITWNINIGDNFYTVADTLFDADINTNSTSTQTSYTPDVTALSAGRCWWLKFTSASTTQIGVFNMNIYGYEN